MNEHHGGKAAPRTVHRARRLGSCGLRQPPRSLKHPLPAEGDARRQDDPPPHITAVRGANPSAERSAWNYGGRGRPRR